MTRVVLSMIVKNSVDRVGNEIFLGVLRSSLQIPYNSIILVDDSTSNKTFEVVKNFAKENDKEIIVARSRLPPNWPHATRATARQTAIDIFFELFREEWLMFLDDDCILNEGWWKWVQENKVIDDNSIGEIWGINWDADPSKRAFIEAIGKSYFEHVIKAFELRGGTHDTLFRRTAIEGVKIPPELHVYEDTWLHNYVKCRGYKWVINPVGVLHRHPPEPQVFKADKQRIREAIITASKYGIYDSDVPGSKLVAWLSLLRPIVGLVPAIWVHLRFYGIQGVPIAVRKQLIKLAWRYYTIRSIKGRVPNICEIIGNYTNDNIK